MKKLFLLASIVCSINCFSQDPNPDLFQTWYLRFVQTSDLSPAFNVLAIVPPISPTLIISNTLNYTGMGACNTFSGSYATMDNYNFQPGPFSESGLSCSTQSHDNFEGSYFGFLQSSGGWYQIYTNGSGLDLVMNNPIFGQAVFQNYQLKTNEFELENIAIYPNPAKEIVHVNTGQLVISKIQIVNSLGQNVKTVNDSFEEVDIADLAIGIYILKMDTSLGMINKKFVKE